MIPAITVQNLGKYYRRYGDRPLTWQEAVMSGFRRMRPIDQFWAIQDVNFTLYAGQMLGVIGKNGAGKSTLLQLLGGIGRPERGRIQVNGRIGALLDLGAGFHGDLTGRENIMINGIVAGLTEREVQRRFDAIVEFSELATFIDNPLRTYSTGMQMRLAFAIAIHANPQVLLVDEFLSVGDLAFQSKCLHRIQDMKQDGCTIVLISHDVRQVEQLCDQAMWLKRGQVVAYGTPEVVVGQYVAETQVELRRETLTRMPQTAQGRTKAGVELHLNQNRFGSLEVEIIDVRLLPGEQIQSGESLTVEIEYHVPSAIAQPIFSVAISREDGQVCLDVNTAEQPLDQIEGKGLLRLQCDRLDLSDGQYFVDVGIYAQDWSYAYDFHWHVYPLRVLSPIKQGVVCPPHHWDTPSRSILSGSIPCDRK
jgi:lipopolysaccharide transport system ATP-binding protein